MDLLQRELERKKQLVAKAKEEAGGSDAGSGSNNKNRKRKFLRQRDLRRLEEEQEERELEEKRLEKERDQKEREEQAEAEAAAAKAAATSLTPDEPMRKKKKLKKDKKKNKKRQQNGDKNIEESTSTTTTEVEDSKSSSGQKAITSTSSTKKSSEEISFQLRNFGLPVRYFGEKEEERLSRLDAALEQQRQALMGLSEKEEFALGKGHGIRNTFLDKDDTTANQNNLLGLGRDGDKKKSSDGDSKDKTEKEKDEDKEKEEDDKDMVGDKDPPKFIYKYLKGLLKEWENDLSLRPDDVARSVQGRNEAKTLKQCKDYIRPLFKLLKSRRLELGMQNQLQKIVQFAKQGEFVKSHDTYMDLAIGRAAWPIGVTMVGIHARTGRAKIESSNVAHVMNSELQRKYLTSVKRLLSYAQKKRPDVDPSKKVS